MFAIRGFIGSNGGGKTLAAVEKAVVPSWQEGRPVLANLSLFPERAGFDRGLFFPLRRWDDLEHFRGGLVFLDEITTVAPSRGYGKMPMELVRLFNQLRKADLELVWTAPAWSRCDIVLREVTQGVTVCQGAYPDRYVREGSGWFPAVVRDESGQKLQHRRAWKPNRKFKWVTYDAFKFDEWTYSEGKKLKPWRTDFRWLYRTEARHYYDTLEGVQLMEHLAGGPVGIPSEAALDRSPVAPRLRQGATR